MKIEDSNLALGFGSGVPPLLYPPKPVEFMSHYTGLPDNSVDDSPRKLIHV